MLTRLTPPLLYLLFKENESSTNDSNSYLKNIHYGLLYKKSLPKPYKPKKPRPLKVMRGFLFLILELTLLQKQTTFA